jgi:hypothetical protein
MSSSDLNTLKQSLRANTRPTWAKARDWDQFHFPKKSSKVLSAEVAETTEHLTNHGCSNVVGAGSTGATQWLTKEHIKEIADVLSSDGLWFNTEVLITVGEK